MTTETDDERRLRIHHLWQDKIAADPWNGWRALLNNWQIEGTSCPVSPEHPFQGYFRARNVDKTFSPVAYWYDNGELVCMRNGREVTDKDKALRDWPYTSRHPISHAWYKTVVEDKKPWPDAAEQVTSDALANSSKRLPEGTKLADTGTLTGEFEPIGRGHNNPPEQTPVEALRNKIANAKGGLVDYAKITTEEQQTKARSLKNRLVELRGEAVAERDKLSLPHLDELERIRGAWSPLVHEADEASKTIVKAMNDYETRLLQQRREDERKAAEVEAERQRVATENAKLAEKAELDGSEPQYQKLPEQPKPTAPPPRTEVSAAYGRKGSVKTKFVVTEITDAQALFKFLTTPKMHSELRTKLLELAQRAKDAGFEPDGVKIEEVAQVKG